MKAGGRRAHSGRKPRDSVWIGCSLQRPLYKELLAIESATGTYGTRVIASVVIENLIGRVVDRELDAEAHQPR